MRRLNFVEERARFSRIAGVHAHNDRSFKNKDILVERTAEAGPTGPAKRNHTLELIKKTTNKLWRFAVLAAPMLPACNMVDNEKINTATVSLAAMVGLGVVLSVVWGCTEAVIAIANRIKNKNTETKKVN